LTVAVAVSQGIGGDPAREGRTGAADAPLPFVADAELDDEALLDGEAEAVSVGVADALSVGEAVVADDAAAVVPEPPEQPARPAAAQSSTSPMPAPPRRAPTRERTAVTGERLPRGLASIVALSRPTRAGSPRRISSCCPPCPV
jgi:FAD/FMN-containing dehydrogenase